ncbi:MAG: ABC transporter permease [Parcubacteria group bacterium]|nr:ABC transporter permease [Parcubacteria group bacterium]
MWRYLRRITKLGLVNFWRNRWVSLATVLVMVLAIFTIGSLIFLNVLLTSSLERLQDKVDITIYFKIDALEDEMITLRDAVAKLDEVRAVEFVSRDEALLRFRERHANNALITQSLDELGENPLEASLNIKAKEPSQYESIARFLDAGAFASVVDKIDYHQNRVVIERLSGILSASRRLGAGISIALIAIAVLVAFNTIRLAIFTSREEISVMRLVGATNRYIRGPFMVEGVLHGVLAAVISLIIFYPLTLWLGPAAERFFGGPNLFQYYGAHIAEFALVLLVLGIFLGAASSMFAMRRYLREGVRR